MRKIQVLVVAGVLLLISMVPAMAQDVAIIEAQDGFGVGARMGGGAEMTGRIVLRKTLGTVPANVTISVLYSAPIAKGFTVDLNGASGVSSPMIDEDNAALLTYNFADMDIYILPGVRVDVRDVESGVVTAQVSSNSEVVLLSGSVEVVTSIEAPVMLVAGDAGTSVLMRGEGAKTKSIMIAEGFGGAFSSDVGLTLKIEGLPEGAGLAFSALGNTDDETSIKGDVMVGGTEIITGGMVTMTTPEDDADAVAVAHSEAGAKDGDDVKVAVDFMDATFARLTEETLGLRLTFTTGKAKPPFMGEVRVSVTMTPDPPDAGEEDGMPFFMENFVPTDGAQVFTFAPASCTMLFPYAASLPALGWNTGLAITNPTAFTSPLDGAITFTLYANGAEMPMTYTTGAGTPGPSALDDAGMLPAGNTYTVLLKELLAWVEPEFDADNDNFIGHLYVKTDFTGCRGVGWITDFGTVNQAYLPYFRHDDADLGVVPGN